MAISKRLRYEIFRRDNHACRYCGRPAPEVTLTVDHVIPETLGGGDEPSNLVTACSDCNNGKSSTPVNASLVDDVSDDALRWSRAMLAVAEIRAADAADRKELIDWFSAIWCRWSDGGGKPIPAKEGFGSIQQFLSAGLSRDDLEEFVDIAMRAKHIPANATWKYFCGCCWNRIRDNIDMAAAIIQAEDTDPNG